MTTTRTALFLGIAMFAGACGSTPPAVNDESNGNRTGADANSRRANTASNQRTSGGDQCSSLEPVYFAFDSSDLDSSSREKLQRAASCAQRTHGQVAVTGMADSRGTEEYNLALGDRRARTVAGYMGSLGVGNVQTSSVGEEYAQGSDESGFARDRRAELQAH